ncbi:hypothetical protein [Desulfurobacterium crinifex]
MKCQDKDTRKAIHLLKSISGPYRKQGLPPEEINRRVRRKLLDILYYQTIHSNNPNIKGVEPKPYHIALEILE